MYKFDKSNKFKLFRSIENINKTKTRRCLSLSLSYDKFYDITVKISFKLVICRA